MHQPQLIRLEDVPAAPWKNGLGSTRVIVGSEPEAVWRLSVAELEQDGEFSSFGGWDRTFCVYGRSPVELTVSGCTHLLAPGDALPFDGEAPVRATLPEGTSQALNLMTRRGAASGTTEVVEIQPDAGPELPHGTVALVPLRDSVRAGDQLCRRGEILLHPRGPLSAGPAGAAQPAVVALVRVSDG